MQFNSGYTPLHIAIINRNSGIVDALVASGVDVLTKVEGEEEGTETELTPLGEYIKSFTLSISSFQTLLLSALSKDELIVAKLLKSSIKNNSEKYLPVLLECDKTRLYFEIVKGIFLNTKRTRQFNKKMVEIFFEHGKKNVEMYESNPSKYEKDDSIKKEKESKSTKTLEAINSFKFAKKYI